MTNINSVLAINLPSLINAEGVTFDYKRVVKFSHKWLQAKESAKLNQFSQDLQLNEVDNQLTSEPLLKLLCLLFEEATIPSQRCQIYKEGLEILLNKWDDKLYIKGDHIYKNLSLQNKQDLLSKIALKTFEQGESFFKEDIEKYIADYIYNLPNVPTHPEVLQLISEAALKSIELQHNLLVEQEKGIYSFSESQFQQYFVAREITCISEPQASDKALKKLVSHINETRWSEVFLLLVGMLQNADYLLKLMKQQIDAIVSKNKELQQFLTRLNQKSNSGKAACKPSTFRAFYLEFILDIDFAESLEDDLSDYHLVNSSYIDTTTDELLNSGLSQPQKVVLKQYYDANKLLLDCLQHARYVTRTVRKEIEETLLVPSKS
jgi:predicted NACHT family NTPase